MLLKLAAAAAALVAIAIASPSSASVPHVLHERREYDPETWEWRRPVPPGRSLPVRIGMTQTNLHQGDELLMEVSRHDSPRYGKHYTAEEVVDLFAPSEETVEAVRGWLDAAGIENFSQSANKQWMQFDTAVENLESLLKAKFHEFEHVETGVVHVACDEYHVPAHVQEHIDYITPGIKLMTTRKTHIDPVKRAAKRAIPNKPWIEHQPIKVPNGVSTSNLAKAKDGNLTSCGAVVTPACVMAFYNISAPTTAVAGNQLGIFEDLAQFYAQEDLNYYFSTIATSIPKGTHPTCHGIDGAPCSDGINFVGAEAELDLQSAYPLIYPQKIVMFSTDDFPTQEDYEYYGFLNNFLDGIDGSYCSYSAFGETGNSAADPSYPDNRTGGYNHKLQCGVYKPTNVISISYGSTEASPGLPLAYQKRQCNEFLKLGLQGVSVVVSSGDYGVSSGGECFGSYYDPIFAPTWPAACPYVTTMGSTTLPAGANALKDQETATTYFSSGGGFSNIYAAPSYQKSAVNHFFDKYPPPYPFYSTTNNQSVGDNDGVYNRIGRGYPDFAAVGWNYLIFVYGDSALYGGTSLSAPIFASILTRINEERLLAGKSTVGFVNPTLYAHPNVFHDITVGSNPACETDGFSCEPGWDPVTGLGTPKFDNMLALFMGLA